MALLPAQESKICSSHDCYSIIEQIGVGAFSNVFSAENLQKEKFALKTFVNIHESCPHENDPEREFLIGTTLKSPNIVKPLDFFSTTSSDGSVSHYLVYPLIEGITLRSIKKGDLLHWQAKRILTQLFSALSYAVSQGKLYTDLHGENILITPNFDVMIIDLGSFYTVEEMLNFFFQNKSMTEKGAFIYYSEIATEFFIGIIKKSNLERTKKLDLCAEFKKIAWNFQEDIEEGKDVSIDDCFDRFLFLLNE